MGENILKIVCLIEDTAISDKLLFEEGMSLFVEYNGKNYLIDTGLTERRPIMQSV